MPSRICLHRLTGIPAPYRKEANSLGQACDSGRSHTWSQPTQQQISTRNQLRPQIHASSCVITEETRARSPRARDHSIPKATEPLSALAPQPVAPDTPCIYRSSRFLTPAALPPSRRSKLSSQGTPTYGDFKSGTFTVDRVWHIICISLQPKQGPPLIHPEKPKREARSNATSSCRPKRQGQTTSAKAGKPAPTREYAARRAADAAHTTSQHDRPRAALRRKLPSGSQEPPCRTELQVSNQRGSGTIVQARPECQTASSPNCKCPLKLLRGGASLTRDASRCRAHPHTRAAGKPGATECGNP